MLEEKQKREGIVGRDKTREVTLLLPQMAKLETRAYAPGSFKQIGSTPAKLEFGFYVIRISHI